MREKIELTVIIPYKDAEKTLRRAALSAAEALETLENTSVELLLVNDHSHDRSGEIALGLSRMKGFIRLIDSEGSGVSAARNTGLEEARGKYVSFVDADDEVAPTIFAVLLEAVRSGADVAGVSFAPLMKDAERETWQESWTREKAADLTGSHPWQSRSPQDFVDTGLLAGDTRVWSKIFITDNTPRFAEDLTVGEDTLFLLESLRYASRVDTMDAPLYGYTINPGGAMLRAYTPSYNDQVRCWERIEETVRELFPELLEKEGILARLSALRLISAMLVAGKIALLPEEQRGQYSATVEELRDKIRYLRKRPGAFAALPQGYKVKISLFMLSPKLYFRSYGAYKGAGRPS